MVAKHGHSPSFLQDPKIGREASNVLLTHADAMQLSTTDPFTHVYMFDKGFPPSLMERLSLAFNKSSASKYLICFKKPRVIVDTYKFKVREVGTIVTKMAGSGEQNTCHVYQRTTESKPLSEGKLRWKFPAAPTDSTLAPPIPHSSSYSKMGLDLLLSRNLDAYQAWVMTQLGTHSARDKRVLRSRRRASK